MGAVTVHQLSAQAAPPRTGPTERDVPFANVGNATLLMDVYRPRQGNGKGIVFISGSSWGGASMYEHDYDDVPLKDDAVDDTLYVGRLVRGLVDRGYAVFSIDHRFAPEVQFPLPLYDCQRAVRFVRAHAAEYGIDATRLGAIGHSSGAHLAALLGATDTVIDNTEGRPAQSGSSRVQAVVTLAGPFVLTELPFHRPSMARSMRNLLGHLPDTGADGKYVLSGVYADASPIRRAGADAAPMLMYQAEDDSVVFKQNAEMMLGRLRALGVPAQLVMRSSGGHAPAFDLEQIDAWFRRYLH